VPSVESDPRLVDGRNEETDTRLLQGLSINHLVKLVESLRTENARLRDQLSHGLIEGTRLKTTKAFNPYQTDIDG
jgi:hypothetical protein